MGDGSLVNNASGGESKVFYQKMKADYYRYKAEYKSGADKEKASESARQAYQDAHNVAEKDLPVTHPIRLGLALNYSVFQYEVWQILRRRVRWLAQHSKMPLLSLTMLLRTPTRTLRSS